jgi:hypothetical protein
MENQKKTIRRQCKCENCGNEAEMVVTCSLEPADTEKSPDSESQKIKGHAVCSHCGNEADMWVDL